MCTGRAGMRTLCDRIVQRALSDTQHFIVEPTRKPSASTQMASMANLHGLPALKNSLLTLWPSDHADPDTHAPRQAHRAERKGMVSRKSVQTSTSPCEKVCHTALPKRLRPLHSKSHVAAVDSFGSSKASLSCCVTKRRARFHLRRFKPHSEISRFSNSCVWPSAQPPSQQVGETEVLREGKVERGCMDKLALSAVSALAEARIPICTKAFNHPVERSGAFIQCGPPPVGDARESGASHQFRESAKPRCLRSLETSVLEAKRRNIDTTALNCASQAENQDMTAIARCNATSTACLRPGIWRAKNNHLPTKSASKSEGNSRI